eukprot:Seg326.1 transcript_id=Seg326.1/GoldUCD/mRNA.D3Y31 product="hypothetical protein" protein_id=Seg326.1/GoldUCD/D3Y31
MVARPSVSQSQLDDNNIDLPRGIDHRNNTDQEDWLDRRTIEKCSECKSKVMELEQQCTKLERSVRKRDQKIMQLERSYSYHQYYFEVGRGFECKHVCESLGEFVSQRTLDIAGTASFESRQTADRRLMEQGLVVISDSELECTTKLGAGETSIVFAGKYKGLDVAVKNYLVFHYSFAVKEYQILTILNSHPNIPHPFGVVRGDIPKLVISLPSSSVPFLKVKLDSEENLCRLTAGLINAITYMDQNGILHNNINCNKLELQPFVALVTHVW